MGKRHPFSPKSRLAACAAALFAALPPCPAEETIFDFPLPPHEQAPRHEWLSAPVTEWEQPGGRRIEIPLRPVPAGERVLLTLVFEERPGMALRVWWEPDSPGGAVALAANLAEGIEGWNQRSFVLPPALAAKGGVVVVETSGDRRVLYRAGVSRLAASEAFGPVNRSNDPLYATTYRVLTTQELSTEEWAMPPDAWSGHLIEAYLQEFPESLKGGVEFGVEIRPAPRRAVLRFAVNSASFAPPSVWVNGAKLEGVSVEIPPMRSPGYVQPPGGGEPAYAGWREAWVRVPPGALRAGENFFLFAMEDQPAYIRQARIEMWFDEALVVPRPEAEIYPEILSDLDAPLPLLPDAGSTLDPPLPQWPPENSPPPQQPQSSPDIDPRQLFRTSVVL